MQAARQAACASGRAALRARPGARKAAALLLCTRRLARRGSACARARGRAPCHGYNYPVCDDDRLRALRRATARAAAASVRTPSAMRAASMFA